MILNVYPDSNAETNTGYQNIIFEIDTAGFPNFSTLIQSPLQTPYDEEECLISCYNIYSWQGFRVIKYVHPKTLAVHEVGVVSLKIEDYEEWHDLDKGCVVGPNSRLDETWLGKRGGIMRERNCPPATLNNNLGQLWYSYERSFGAKPTQANKAYPLWWLNAPFETKLVGNNTCPVWPVSTDELKVEPRGGDNGSLNNWKFRELEIEQQQRRAQNKK